MSMREEKRKTAYKAPDGEERICHKKNIEWNSHMAKWLKPSNAICIEGVKKQMCEYFYSDQHHPGS